MEYELLFFTSVANEDRAPEIKREIDEIITSQSGKITGDFSDIGKRKFAHPIKKQTHGFFSFCRFTLEENEKMPEISRRLSLNDKVMRHLIVRADEIGKSIGAQTVDDSRREREAGKKNEVIRPAAAQVPAAEKEGPAEESAKVEMAELDEKLDEILKENPE